MDKVTHREVEINQDSQSMLLFELLKEEGFRRVCRALEHAVGTAEASLYSELLSRRDYFEKRDQLDDEGYFFNTVLDLQHGTALSDKRQRTTIRRLEQLGLIKTKLKDSPPKRYFKINDNENVLKGFLLQGKAVMDCLEKQKESQKQRIEKDQLTKENYFSPKTFKSSQTADLKSSILADSNITKRQTNKNKVNKNKERESSLDSNDKEQALKIIIEHFKKLYQEKHNRQPVVSNSNLNTITNLIDKHDAELIAECLTLHIKEPDSWTTERASSLGTFEHNLEGYLEKINKRWLNEESEKMQRLYQQKMDQEQREKEEQLARERAEYEALPELDKTRRELEKHNELVEALRPLREEAAAAGDKASAEKLKEYGRKESELKAKIKELEAKEISR